uniref:Putative secreted protein n=1 Tax=Anopheles marajoara TaxID=58244 RepID=A0A2M4C949_9DIPT
MQQLTMRPGRPFFSFLGALDSVAARPKPNSHLRSVHDLNFQLVIVQRRASTKGATFHCHCAAQVNPQKKWTHKKTQTRAKLGLVQIKLKIKTKSKN